MLTMYCALINNSILKSNTTYPHINPDGLLFHVQQQIVASEEGNPSDPTNRGRQGIGGVYTLYRTKSEVYQVAPVHPVYEILKVWFHFIYFIFPQLVRSLHFHPINQIYAFPHHFDCLSGGQPFDSRYICDRGAVFGFDSESTWNTTTSLFR